ncbi:MAG: hypothetical protein HYZ42_08210 [Bacteroidetes bacterium]|nr:hypothetical protein [Bacteroidota bacterium]
MEYSHELVQIFDDEKLIIEGLDDSFRTKLAQRIGYLMQNQHQFLFNLFYRIDLNEQKVKNAIALSNDQEIYFALADLVIEREIKRQETRKLYSSKNKIDDGI